MNQKNPSIKRFFNFLGLQKSMVGLLTMVILVGLGERMAERFLPLYLIAVGGGAISVGLLKANRNLRRLLVIGMTVPSMIVLKALLNTCVVIPGPQFLLVRWLSSSLSKSRLPNSSIAGPRVIISVSRRCLSRLIFALGISRAL